MPVMPVQPANAYPPTIITLGIEVTLLRSKVPVKPVQPWNVWSSIVFRLLGRLSVVKPVQPLNV